MLFQIKDLRVEIFLAVHKLQFVAFEKLFLSLSSGQKIFAYFSAPFLCIFYPHSNVFKKA